MAIGRFISNIALYRALTRRLNRTGCKQGIGCGGTDVPIYVINLERNSQRRRFAVQHVANLGFEARVFPAIDGKSLNRMELEDTGLYDDELVHQTFSRSLSAAEIGCALSHLRLYEHLRDQGTEMAIVLEDDAVLDRNIATRLPELIRDLPEDWDVVQLIYECRDYERINPKVVRFLSKRCMPVAAAGYLLRNTGIEKLLKNAYPLRYPADSYIGRSPRWGVNVYGAAPKLVTINNIFPSDIAHHETIKEKASNVLKKGLVWILR